MTIWASTDGIKKLGILNQLIKRTLRLVVELPFLSNRESSPKLNNLCVFLHRYSYLIEVCYTIKQHVRVYITIFSSSYNDDFILLGMVFAKYHKKKRLILSQNQPPAIVALCLRLEQ